MLSKQVFTDLEAYFAIFPEERKNIDSANEGNVFVLTRINFDASIYAGLPCQVRTTISVQDLAVLCCFPHMPKMDRSFRIELDQESGALCLMGTTIADLSRYILTPVIFDRLVATEENVSEID